MHEDAFWFFRYFILILQHGPWIYDLDIHSLPVGDQERMGIRGKLGRVVSSTSAPPTTAAKQTRGLSTGEKVGIGVTAGLVGVVFVFVALFDIRYLRRKRRDKAIQNGQEKVERGEGKWSEERIVLESRVEVVFDNEDEGRNEMSLPRRE
ncbi:hypothetical protein K469DRAFT_697645 [Zopfia rhizophila CBS 207.26]|uniref:Uncharacterized protein n=1 Tax=Zopfia rhizophila CBS 207.26 TaxID=1314779 RepID=A0A6A6EKF4_9PEZI|nr:hypothetical protein K469DRAFT_697645 [Zopfia rhizophila CBS 207.26]